MLQKPNSALLIVGHGSTVNPDSSAPTYAHADAIRHRGHFAEVLCAFWKEEPSLREVARMITSDEIYVVPNFISEGYFTRKIIPRELELTGDITERDGRIWKYCPPVGSHPRMTEALLRRAHDIAPGVPPAETSLLIIGHGTNLNDNSATAVKEQVARITALGLYAEVLAGFMEEEPFCSDWTRLATQRSVVAVPFFVSDGLHSYQDIPVLLGIEPEPTAAASERGLFRDNPHRLGDRDLYYANAIGTEPLFAEAILDQVAAFDASGDAPSRSGDAPVGGSARGAPASRPDPKLNLPSRIGQLHLEAHSITHESDRDRTDLQIFTHPEDARTLALLDDAGRYRPLKTAPNLRRGWQLRLSSAAEVRTALDYFYPAMLATWQQRQQLTPTHFRETAARQSGMYAVVKKITDEHASALICDFCQTQTGCLKRILWQLDTDTPINNLPAEKSDPTQHGDELPLLCLEPCNLLIAAAREVVKSPTQAA